MFVVLCSILNNRKAYLFVINLYIYLAENLKIKMGGEKVQVIVKLQINVVILLIFVIFDNFSPQIFDPTSWNGIFCLLFFSFYYIFLVLLFFNFEVVGVGGTMND
eukprot:TRINITY_DN30509_c0_g1_i1.p4 TRINITY_DN30509_c0_g1~~TRINITY_DN30509_c0_g1_i1.p4  ORF type:complete len:105 (+),score=8.70 TRINITY_DN30509_c0_g1_i1:606-920(+)